MVYTVCLTFPITLKLFEPLKLEVNTYIWSLVTSGLWSVLG